MSCKRKAPPSDELRQRFGANLRECRERIGISQHELARRSDIALAAVSQFELGKKMPRIDTFLRLAGAVEARPNELMAGIVWSPAEVVATPGSFEVPDDELAAEAEELRRRTRRIRGRKARR